MTANSEDNAMGYGYFGDDGIEETIEYDLSFDESYVYVPSRESPYVITGEEVDIIEVRECLE